MSNPPGKAVDWSGLIEQIGDDPEVLRDIVDAYATEMREHLENLPKQVAAGDGAEARRAAHTIKGSLKLFGAAEAAAIAYEIEQQAGDDVGAVGDRCERLEAHVRPVLRALEHFLATGER